MGAVPPAAKPQRRSGLPTRPAEPAIADGELCRRARLGDAEAFHVIFQRHAPPVRRFLASTLRDDADADEAAQETFIRAHSRLAALKEPERLLSWLLGIARIVALDSRYLRRRDAEREETNSRGTVVPLDPTPEARLLDKEAERVLATEIDTLSPHRRAALVLRVDHELGYPEIAEAMGWPLQKVKNEIHRARMQIRERILRYLAGRA
jgi:RNA polymerase sigma-70 factor (ECF subfamily)